MLRWLPVLAMDMATHCVGTVANYYNSCCNPVILAHTVWPLRSATVACCCVFGSTLPYPSLVAEANKNRIRKEPAYVKDSTEATATKAAHLVFRRQLDDFCTSCLCGCTAFACGQVGLLNHSLQTLKRLEHGQGKQGFGEQTSLSYLGVDLTQHYCDLSSTQQYCCFVVTNFALCLRSASSR